MTNSQSSRTASIQGTAVDKAARESTPASSSGVPPDGAPTLAAGRRQNPQARTPALHFVTGPAIQGPLLIGSYFCTERKVGVTRFCL